MAAQAGHEVKGKVAVLHGTVKAISPDGVARVLTVNSLIYADDKIITGGDGSISIVFGSVPPTQLDLGRMSEVQITEDVYGGHATPAAVADATAEQEAIQAALLQGEQPIQLDATAAGGELSSGGGHPIWVVNPDWHGVTPESGAETRGIQWTGPEAGEFDPNVIQATTTTSPTLPEQPLTQPEQPLIQSEQPLIQSEQPLIQSEQSVINPEQPLIQPEQSLIPPEQPVIPPEPPVINYQPSAGSVAVQINDDTLAHGNEAKPGDYSPHTENLTGTLVHDFGGDDAGSIALLNTGAPDGFTYVVNKAGTELEVYQGKTLVMHVTIDPATGAYAVVQDNAVIHPDVGGENYLTLDINYQVTDSNGDHADGSIAIKVIDDIPYAFAADSVQLLNSEIGASATNMPLHFVENAGADGVKSVAFAEIAEGSPVMDAAGHQLSYNGYDLHYSLSSDGTFLSAINSEGQTGFTIQLSAEGDSYTINTNGDILNGTEAHVTDIIGEVGGQNAPFEALLDVENTIQDVLFTTANGYKINASHDFVGISKGQSISAGEGIKISFVNDLVIAGKGINATYSFDGNTPDGYNESTMFREKIVHDGNIKVGESISIKLTAYNAENSDGSCDPNSVKYGSGTPLDLDSTNSHVAVYDSAGNEVKSGYTVNYGDAGSITISGLKSGWDFKLITDGDHPFTSIQIDGAKDSSGNPTVTFKLGDFSYGDSHAGDPIHLNYQLTGTDADGDHAAGTLTTVLNHDASAPGTFAAIKFGTEGDDNILGNDGNELLVGKSGADVLKGLGGTNAYDGGSGADTFTITKGETAKILDFNPSEGDKVVLDFSLGNHYKITVASDSGMAKVLVESGGATTTISTNISYESIPTPGGELDHLLGQLDPNPHH